MSQESDSSECGLTRPHLSPVSTHLEATMHMTSLRQSFHLLGHHVPIADHPHGIRLLAGLSSSPNNFVEPRVSAIVGLS